MAKRTRSTHRRMVTRTVLLLGLAAAVAGLVLPWAEIDPEAYGLLEDALSSLGLIPQAGQPVRGYEIPWRIREETGRAGVATALVIRDLGRGRLDRAAARALFGERIESSWAPMVLLPASLALLHALLGLALRRPATLLWSWLALIDLIVTGACALGYVRALDARAGTPLIVHAGVPVTLAAMVLLLVGALRASRR